jgi:hypothetical protein
MADWQINGWPSFYGQTGILNIFIDHPPVVVSAVVTNEKASGEIVEVVKQYAEGKTVLSR